MNFDELLDVNEEVFKTNQELKRIMRLMTYFMEQNEIIINQKWDKYPSGKMLYDLKIQVSHYIDELKELKKRLTTKTG